MLLNVKIPLYAKCLLKTGQSVDLNTPFLEKNTTEDVIIDVAGKLNIPSDKIFNFLLKFVGDTINKGDILAKKKALLTELSVTSDSNGILKEINHYEGKIIISAVKSKMNQSKAFFTGEVVEIKKDHIKIKVGHIQEFALKFSNADFGGATYYLKDSQEPMFAQQIAEKILITESIASYYISKAEVLGVMGFVTLKSPPEDSDLPKAQLKNILDFQKILKADYPFCLIDKSNAKLFLYR